MKKIKAEIPKEIKLTVEEIQHPESSAKILLDGGGKSGKRMPFRRTMKQIMEKAMVSHNVKGVKVAMSGTAGRFGKWEEKSG